MTAQQGHLYSYLGREVIALECGDVSVQVRELCPDEPSGMGQKYPAYVEMLEPQPMKYFCGEVPT